MLPPPPPVTRLFLLPEGDVPWSSDSPSPSPAPALARRLSVSLSWTPPGTSHEWAHTPSLARSTPQSVFGVRPWHGGCEDFFSFFKGRIIFHLVGRDILCVYLSVHGRWLVPRFPVQGGAPEPGLRPRQCLRRSPSHARRLRHHPRPPASLQARVAGPAPHPVRGPRQAWLTLKKMSPDGDYSGIMFSCIDFLIFTKLYREI